MFGGFKRKPKRNTTILRGGPLSEKKAYAHFARCHQASASVASATARVADASAATSAARKSCAFRDSRKSCVPPRPRHASASSARFQGDPFGPFPGFPIGVAQRNQSPKWSASYGVPLKPKKGGDIEIGRGYLLSLAQHNASSHVPLSWLGGTLVSKTQQNGAQSGHDYDIKSWGTGNTSPQDTQQSTVKAQQSHEITGNVQGSGITK